MTGRIDHWLDEACAQLDRTPLPDIWWWIREHWFLVVSALGWLVLATR